MKHNSFLKRESNLFKNFKTSFNRTLNDLFNMDKLNRLKKATYILDTNNPIIINPDNIAGAVKLRVISQLKSSSPDLWSVIINGSKKRYGHVLGSSEIFEYLHSGLADEDLKAYSLIPELRLKTMLVNEFRMVLADIIMDSGK